MREQKKTISVEIEPLDTLFFRDGRPFESGMAAQGGLPMPQTIAGALRTWLLRREGVDFGVMAADVKRGDSFAEATARQGTSIASIGRLEFRGPWFAKGGKRLVPLPATIEIDKKDDNIVYRLDPLEYGLPGWKPRMNGLLPLWRRNRNAAKSAKGYLTPAGLQRFLEGNVPKLDEIIPNEEIFVYEKRTGIGLNSKKGTAEDGLIYSVRMLRLQPDVTLSVDIVGASEDIAICSNEEDVLSIGGEGRKAIVRRTASHWEWPNVPAEKGRRQLILLTTPAPFNGWKPPALTPVAAAVPGNVPVSGWDLARGGPKPNRFAVPAGSVYFLNETSNLSNSDQPLCTGEDAALGWGAYVGGIWNYA